MNTDDLLPARVGDERTRSSPHRRLRRLPERGMIGGVCAGLGEYLDVDPLAVRLVFIVVALVTGIGLGLYPLAWALIPADPAEAGTGRPWRERLSGWRDAIAIVLLTGVALLALRRAGLWLGDEIVVPLVLACCGVALILREASAPNGLLERHRGSRLTASSGRGASGPRWRWPAGVLGVALVLGAAVLFLYHSGSFSRSHHQLGGFAVVLVALMLVFGPWLVRLGRSLANERSARIRSQERADVAVHLHDSVLQTLALIQRRAEDPREVAGLARRQERELRRWLFERSDTAPAETLASALEQAAAEIEELYRVRVEVVIVGDVALDERLAAAVSATREALTNAAKFAARDEIDLFAEVGAQHIQVFVRDRGVGFDPATIPEDRKGVRHSIVGRMRQHGGRAEIRSEPGAGTEVELSMELSPR